MMDITITIDETQNAQTIYSPDLDAFLQIYTLQQSDLDVQTQAATDAIAVQQARIDALTPVIAVRTTAVAAGPVGLALKNQKTPAQQIIP
jgi:hypothetical protein